MAIVLQHKDPISFEEFSVIEYTSRTRKIANFLMQYSLYEFSKFLPETALEDEDLGRLKISPFFDVGIVWNTNGDFSQSLASLGVRLDWQLKDSVFFRFDYGISLIDVPERGDSLSDNNFSFSVEINF